MHNTQQETDIHAPGGIKTRYPSKRAAADPRLRTRAHWGRFSLLLGMVNIVDGCPVREGQRYKSVRECNETVIEWTDRRRVWASFGPYT
jgi:hypothetical protein